MTKLFDSFQIRGLTLKNHVCVSPMSQYRAKDGVTNDWHFAHLSRFALGGCGIGGPHPPASFPIGPAFQTDFAKEIRQNADIASMAVGFIWEARVANTVIESGQADLIAIGKELLNNPYWTLQAAKEIAADESYSLLDPAIGWWLNKRERVMRKLGL